MTKTTKIKRTDLDSLTSLAASRSPSITDRLAHAKDLVERHPADETAPPAPAQAPAPAPAAVELQSVSAGKLQIDPATKLEMLLTPADLAHVLPHRQYLAALSLVSTESKNNARVFYPNDELDATTTSLQEDGQYVPAVGYVPLDRSQIVLIDGQMRARGLISGGGRFIRFESKPAPEDRKAEYLMSRNINGKRSSQTALDDAIRWDQLIQDGVYESAAALAAAMGKSEATISQVRSINNIPMSLLMRMKDKDITSSKAVACAVASIFVRAKERDSGITEEDALRMAQEVVDATIDRQLSRVQVEALVKSKLQGPATRTRGNAVKFTFAGNEGGITVYPGKGELKLAISGLDASALDRLQLKLNDLFKEEKERALDAKTP